MRRRIGLLAGLTTAALGATGCATIYVPAPAHVALVEEKGDLQVSLYTGGASGGGGAYGVTDKLSVRARGHSYGEDRGFQGEVGIGYLTHPEEYPGEVGPRIGGSLDIGGGSVFNRNITQVTVDDVTTERVREYGADFLSATLQGVGGYEGEHFAVGGVFRLAAQRHALNVAETNLDPLPPASNLYLFMEPMGYVRAGYRPVFLEATLGISIPFDALPAQTTYVPIVFGLGITVEPDFADRDE